MIAQKRPLAHAVRLAIGSAFGLATVLSAPLAFSQAPAAQKDIEEVVITGSHIVRANSDTPSPIVIVDRDALDKSGYTNLNQLFEKMPAVGNGTFSTRGNNQDSTANGGASISLRGLGADATLTLVNGRRVAISPFAESITTNFVDINSIPVAAIERIEVLKDGASAVYGSDAVAGVVNLVLREDFEGAEVTVGYGDTWENDYDETSLSAIWGLNTDEGNVTVIFDYFNNSTLENQERGSLGSADQTSRGGEDQRSSRGSPGRFVVDGVTTIDPACPPERRAGQTCLYDYGPWNLLTPEAHRTGVLLLGHQKLTDDVEFFTEIAAQHNTSIAQGAPTGLDGDAALSVPVTHPNNPFPGATDIQIARLRTVDAGPRQWDIETDNLRGVFGLRGEFSDWDWEVSMQRARSESDQTGNRSQGWIRSDYLQTEINAGRYNPFGGVKNPQSVIDAISTSLVRKGESELTTYDAQITGPMFEMSGGDAAMAAGVEYREESAEDRPDDQFVRGLIQGTEAVSASASRDITSAYVEFSFPLLDTLELSVAGRYDDYSDFGSTENPKIALRWEPIEMLAFRASWGTGFRAPSLAQIGLGPSKDSLFLDDTYGCLDNPAYCANTDYLVVFSGNPNLDAEKSESYNFGVAIKPLEGLSITFDYFDIQQDDKIDRVPAQYLLDRFCNTQNSTVCVRGTPLPGDTLGILSSVNSSFLNIGEQSVQGVDTGISYDTDLAGGSLNLTFDHSYLIKFKKGELDSTGALFLRDLTGEYEYPEHRWVLSGDWEGDQWGMHAAVNYIGEFEDLPAGIDYDANNRTVADFTTVNMQIRYSGFAKTMLALGVDNLLDEEPPFAIGDGDADLYGYVSSQHNPRGRFAYAKLTYKFK